MGASSHTFLEPHKRFARVAAPDRDHHRKQEVQHRVLLQARGRPHGVALERL